MASHSKFLIIPPRRFVVRDPSESIALPLDGPAIAHRSVHPDRTMEYAPARAPASHLANLDPKTAKYLA